jgi:thiazole/oxazole-forming peptide maturase SagD family component
VVCGAELTGVHTLLGQRRPASYHIGGAGIFLHEAMIRALGETYERYSQFVSELWNGFQIQFSPYRVMLASGSQVPRNDCLSLFQESDYQRRDFPFDPYDDESPIGWIRVHSMTEGGTAWVPAQLVLLGYRVRRESGEPWLCTAVTTGTAAHTSRERSLLNAILELVQVDAAMGHWYSGRTAPRIHLGQARLTALRRVILRQMPGLYPQIRLHWLPSPDLPGLTVACVIQGPKGQIPAGGVGVATDLTLEVAAYKALLEAVGVLLLGKLNLLNRNLNGKDAAATIVPADTPGEKHIYDLDNNVNLYADPMSNGKLDERFEPSSFIDSRELPADCDYSTGESVRLLVESFRKSKKQLVALDLTSEEGRHLGLSTSRVWSPQTLSLCLPSAPPSLHPRFEDYGGIKCRDPHPYP